jgi:hypothetical protein
MAGRVLLRRLICRAQHRLVHATQPHKIARGYSIDLSGKVAFVAGVADSTGNVISMTIHPSCVCECVCVRASMVVCVCLSV